MNYNELEKQRRLFITPCSIGDTVYYICKDRYSGLLYSEIHEYTITGFEITDQLYIKTIFPTWINTPLIPASEWGINLFATIEDAENTLEKIKGKYKKKERGIFRGEYKHFISYYY